ncbi:hypothetical protein WA158_000934 [Blastocystis sp. Blastoise]
MKKISLSLNSLKPNSMNNMSNQKIANFVFGSHKKTKYELEQEKAKQKQKEEEEETAKLYKEFLTDFGDTVEDKKAPTFLHGGSVQPSNASSINSSLKGTVYQMEKSIPINNNNNTNNTNNTNNINNINNNNNNNRTVSTSQSVSTPSTVKSTNVLNTTTKSAGAPKMILLNKKPLGGLGNVKFVFTKVNEDKKIENNNNNSNNNNQIHNNNNNDNNLIENINSNIIPGNTLNNIFGASTDNLLLEEIDKKQEKEEDNLTLYVGNISVATSLEDLYSFFAQYGHIYSIKLMPPKESIDGGMNMFTIGFVGFRERSMALRAYQHGEGQELKGSNLRLGWSKDTYKPGTYISIPNVPLGATYLYITPPEDKKVAKIIQKTAEYTSKFGSAFETPLIERETKKKRDLYKFLWDTTSSEYLYYRWCVYIQCNGETVNSYSFLPFPAYINGPFIIPPYTPLYNDQQPNTAKPVYEVKKKKPSLPDAEFDHLSDLLRNISLSRGNIRQVMGYILDEEKYIYDCLYTVKESICVPDIWIGLKIARLYVLHDILMNCHIIKKGTEARGIIQDILPEIFMDMNSDYRHIEGYLEKEQVKSRLQTLFTCWEINSVFSSKYIYGCEMLMFKADEDFDKYDLPDAELLSVYIDQYNVSNPDHPLSKEKEKEKEAEDIVRRECKMNGLYIEGDYFEERIINLLLYRDFIKQKAENNLADEIDDDLDGAPLEE